MKTGLWLKWCREREESCYKKKTSERSGQVAENKIKWDYVRYLPLFFLKNSDFPGTEGGWKVTTF